MKPFYYAECWVWMSNGVRVSALGCGSVFSDLYSDRSPMRALEEFYESAVRERIGT